MNIDFCQINNLHSGNSIVVKQLKTVTENWVKILDNQGQVEIFILDLKKETFDTPT